MDIIADLLFYAIAVPAVLIVGISKGGVPEGLRIMAPVAPLGIWLGINFQKRLPEAIFYRICLTLIFLTGCRLAWQGIEGLTG